MTAQAREGETRGEEALGVDLPLGQPDAEVRSAKREQLLNGLLQLSARYGWSSLGRHWTGALARLLNSNECERCIVYHLEHPEIKEHQRFDPLYLEKSVYSTRKILDALKSRLDLEEYHACLAEEVRDDFGIYDISIVQGSYGDPCTVLRGDTQVCKIEGIALEQLDRYLMSPCPLLVVKVVMRQVMILRPEHRVEGGRLD